jgi:hypothetical protein
MIANQYISKTKEQREQGGGRNIPSHATDAHIEISNVLEKIAGEKNTAITSIAMAYVMHKSPYVFPIVGGRKIEHLKANIEALNLNLSVKDIKEIEGAVSFDIGFPQKLLGGPGGARGPRDVGLNNNLGHFDWVESLKVCSDVPLTKQFKSLVTDLFHGSQFYRIVKIRIT